MITLVNITTENYLIYLEPIMEIENLSFPSPWNLSFFKEEVKNPVSHLWTVFVYGVLSGYICFRMVADEIQLLNIAVHPRKRDNGLGQCLLKKMICAGISEGIQSIWLEVRTSNLIAHRLYEKLGFKEISKKPGYYRDTNEDAIVMALSLSQKERCHKTGN